MNIELTSDIQEEIPVRCFFDEGRICNQECVSFRGGNVGVGEDGINICTIIKSLVMISTRLNRFVQILEQFSSKRGPGLADVIRSLDRNPPEVR